jgi:hypothetical protein
VHRRVEGGEAAGTGSRGGGRRTSTGRRVEGGGVSGAVERPASVPLRSKTRCDLEIQLMVRAFYCIDLEIQLMVRAFYCKVNAFSRGAARLKSDDLHFKFALLHASVHLH